LDNISEAIVCAIGYKRAFLALENKSHEKAYSKLREANIIPSPNRKENFGYDRS